MFGAKRSSGERSSRSGNLTECPIASPNGKYRCASVRLMRATGAPLRFSAWLHTRPRSNGMRSSAKYSGLTILIEPIGCSSAGLPSISNRELHPFRGGVALLEIAATLTPGVSPL
jgi:hypothetical protein